MKSGFWGKKSQISSNLEESVPTNDELFNSIWIIFFFFFLVGFSRQLSGQMVLGEKIKSIPFE